MQPPPPRPEGCEDTKRRLLILISMAPASSSCFHAPHLLILRCEAKPSLEGRTSSPRRFVPTNADQAQPRLPRRADPASGRGEGASSASQDEGRRKTIAAGRGSRRRSPRSAALPPARVAPSRPPASRSAAGSPPRARRGRDMAGAEVTRRALRHGHQHAAAGIDMLVHRRRIGDHRDRPDRQRLDDVVAPALGPRRAEVDAAGVCSRLSSASGR